MNNNSTFFFLKQLFFEPSKVGALLPSSSSLKNVILEFTKAELKNHEVLEIGPGTGAFTLDLESLTTEKLKTFSVIEINKNFADYLRTRLKPSTNILHICASELNHYRNLENPYLVISSIPLKSLSRQKTVEILKTFHSVLIGHPESIIIQYSYGTQPPPLLTESASLQWEQVSFVIRNMPPATVWRLRCRA